MPQDSLSILEHMAHNRKGIFADETIRKNYYKAKELYYKQKVIPQFKFRGLSGNRLLLFFHVKHKETSIYITKEINIDDFVNFQQINRITDMPGRWYCSYCGKFSNRKLCEHVFLVVLDGFEDPSVISKDQFYTISKQAKENAKRFLTELIKTYKNVRVCSNGKIVVSGDNNIDYVIDVTKKRICVRDAKVPQLIYCVISAPYPDLSAIPYPIEDIIASLILFLSNNSKRIIQ